MTGANGIGRWHRDRVISDTNPPLGIDGNQPAFAIDTFTKNVNSGFTGFLSRQVLCDEIADFRESWKRAAAARERNDSSIATAHIDNLEAMKGFSNSADSGKIDAVMEGLAKSIAFLTEKVTAMEQSRDEDLEIAKQLLADTSENIALKTGNSVIDATPSALY